MSEDRETQSPGETAADGPAGANRRGHARLRAEDLKDLGARLASGAEIRLIDLSRSGAQFECDRRFLPNAVISLRLVTADTTFVVSGRVVRSRIVRLDRGGLGYNVAVSFTELLQHLLEEPASAPAAPLDATEPDSAPQEIASDVTADEAAAFDAAAEEGSTVLTVTAALDQTSDDVRDLFNGNNW